MEGLIGALRDKDSDVRNAAIEALSNIDDPRVKEEMIASLKDEDATVRCGVAVVLAASPDPRAKEPLIAALTDEDATVRYCATRALGNLVVAGPDARAVEALIAVLKDADSDVRLCAGQALCNMNDPGVVDALIAALKDENWADRGFAAVILGQLDEGVAGVGDPRIMETLIAALKDEDAGVRRGAAMALGALYDKRALEPLLTAGTAEQDPDVESAMDEAVARSRASGSPCRASTRCCRHRLRDDGPGSPTPCFRPDDLCVWAWSPKRWPDSEEARSPRPVAGLCIVALAGRPARGVASVTVGYAGARFRDDRDRQPHRGGPGGNRQAVPGSASAVTCTSVSVATPSCSRHPQPVCARHARPCPCRARPWPRPRSCRARLTRPRLHAACTGFALVVRSLHLVHRGPLWSG